MPFCAFLATVTIATILAFEVDFIYSCTPSSSGQTRSQSLSMKPTVAASETDVAEPSGKSLQVDDAKRRVYTGGLRLTGGKLGSYGIVEVTYDNIWGTICDDGMKQTRNSASTTAKVICRLLGFPEETTTAIWFSFAYRNIPRGYAVMQSTARKIWLDDFYCRGNETNIDQCLHARPGVHNCLSIENIGVICKGSTVATTTTTQSSTKSSMPLESTTEPIVPAPGQEITPSPPTPLPSTCGHSMYYNSNSTPGSRVVGGVLAQPNQYPWIARLLIDTDDGYYYQCGGSIISETHILTAAHCLYGLTITRITAYLGDYDTEVIDPGEVAVTVSSWTIHPSFIPTTYDYDFAILRFSQISLTFTSMWNIQPICLPSTCDAGCSSPSSIAYIAGWGTTRYNGSLSQILRSAFVQIGDPAVCNAQYNNTMTERMLCAGYLTGGVDTCQGDSGGPLMSNKDGYYKLCGVTSFGTGCALPNYYGIYSKVCSQLTWIKANAGLT